MIQVVLEIKVSTVAKSTLIVLLYVNSSTFFVDSEANKKNMVYDVFAKTLDTEM